MEIAIVVMAGLAIGEVWSRVSEGRFNRWLRREQEKALSDPWGTSR